MVGGIDKVATLLLMATPENAAKVFALLDEDEIKLVSQAMSRLGFIPIDTAEYLVLELQTSMPDKAYFLGNMQNTERFLRQVLGKEKGAGIMEDIRELTGHDIWNKLGSVKDEVLANYLKSEYPQTAALILSKLEPPQAARVLSQLNQEFAFEVMKRMTVMDSVKQEVLDRVEKTLRSEFDSGLAQPQKIDQSQVLAEIFNNFDRTHGAAFMAMLQKHDATMAEQIKNLMFTFDDLKRIKAQGLQNLIKVADKGKLTVALKGASEEVRELFLHNMSPRAAKILLAEMENHPVKLRDVDSAQADIINLARSLIAKGAAEMNDNQKQVVG